MSYSFGPLLGNDPANPTPWIAEFSQKRKKSDKKNSDPVPTQQELIHELLFDPIPPRYVPSFLEKATIPKHRIPFGLEALDSVNSSLLVLRRPENSIRLLPEQRLLAFAQFDIVDEDGHQLYIAVEKTSSKALKWTRDARMFHVTMYDHSGMKVLEIKRFCSPAFCCAQYCCGFGIFGFKGCGNNVEVRLCQGDAYIGRIEQEYSWKQTILRIFNETGKEILIIHGKLVDGIFDIAFPDDDDEPIAMIETSMTVQEVSAFYKIQISSYEDPYGLTILDINLSPKHKALIIAAMILMDYIFLKPTTDYPHWTQFIPYDFKAEDQTREKVFKDGSKEIIVTSMKPKNNWINMLRHERRCGCCYWFCSLICICCPLGFVRNGLRCVLLILFICLIAVIIIVVVVHVALMKK